MRRMIPLLLALLLLTACGQKEAEPSPYRLYFTVGSDTLYGDSIASEDYVWDSDYLNVRNMLSALLDGPDDPTLTNPFPSGTQLIWASWRSDGVLTLNLTEEYGGLTGIALTQADYCIVRTACQIDGVTGVEILSANQENPFRHHTILTLEDIL